MADMQPLVAEVMATAVARVGPLTSLSQAARLLRERGVTAVPVVDEGDHVLPVVADGKLVGMVTRRDLLAAFLRADEQVRRQIVHALEMTFHLVPDQVAVTVHNGVVRLEGRVERRSLADELERLVAAVDGVIGVESRLQWDLDDASAAGA